MGCAPRGVRCRIKGRAAEANVVAQFVCGLLQCLADQRLKYAAAQTQLLRQQISGVQQQGLLPSRWCKNLAARCFKEGTVNDVRKYMIRSRLSSVSDSHFKLL